jgi:hypothetical protein
MNIHNYGFSHSLNPSISAILISAVKTSQFSSRLAKMTSYDFRASNVGPLTTTFTAPSSCFQTTSFSSVDLYSTYFWIGYGPGVGLNYETESDSCVPQLAMPTPLVYNWYYSPGICPTGYILGASLATGPQARTCTSVLPSSVTAWLCCPT